MEYPNSADGIANSGDPEQIAPLGAVLSGLHCQFNKDHYLEQHLSNVRAIY